MKTFIRIVALFCVVFALALLINWGSDKKEDMHDLSFPNHTADQLVEMVQKDTHSELEVLNEVTITWVSDPDEVFEKLQERNKTVGGVVGGTANIKGSKEGGDCTIWVQVPKGQEDVLQTYILGHEVLHCFAGDYHN